MSALPSTTQSSDCFLFSRLFWHQLMRKAFTSHAVFLATRVLHLPPRTKTTRYFILFFSFLIVAVMHIFTNPTPSLCTAWPQIRYYASTALAIMIEDTVIALGRGKTCIEETRPSDGLDQKRKEGTSKKFARGDNHMDSPRVHSRTFCSRGPGSSGAPKLGWRILGYCWVVSFDMWATSKLIYATAQCT